MKTTISLKELLDFEFTANEDGKIVAEISLERINLIADILTNQKERIDKAIDFIDSWEKYTKEKRPLEVSMLDLLYIKEILSNGEEK